jgi:membrane protein implicated in regulation of membrane protease activity
MNANDRLGYYQSTSYTSALDQIYAKLRSGAADLGNAGAQIGGFVFGVGEQAVGMAKGLGQLAIDANLASAYLIGKAVGAEQYLPSTFSQGYSRMEGVYNAATNFVKLPVGDMLKKVFLDPVVHTWEDANNAYAAAAKTDGFAPAEWFDYGRALGAFSVNVALSVTGAAGLVKAGYSLAKLAGSSLESAMVKMASSFGEAEALATTTRGTLSFFGREFQVMHRFRNGGALVKTGDEVWHVPSGKSLADVPVNDLVGNALQDVVNQVTPTYTRGALTAPQQRAIARLELTGDTAGAASLEARFKGSWVQSEAQRHIQTTNPGLAAELTWSRPFQNAIDVQHVRGLAYDIHTNVLGTMIEHGRTYSTQLWRAITY